MEPNLSESAPPPVPDHELLRPIARGSYGMVWLARSLVGSHRAVKVIRRATFKSARQYEREFQGVRHFEPVSRTHPGFVHILHVGRNEEDGHFYYVMELADDIEPGTGIIPERYQPRTLRSELDRRRRLPVDECVQLAVPLLDALEELHRRGLVHRDIKPANFIFVGGAPKFADIGLVANQSSEGTAVGTAGYNPPEGSGQPVGDLFSFGRVLFEMFSGIAVQGLGDQLPELKPRLSDERERAFLDVVLHACQPDARRRFDSAGALRDALVKSFTGSGTSMAPAAAQAQPAAEITAAGGDSPVELTGGAMPPESPYYVRRETDAAFEAALGRRESVILIRGVRQTGKTSLLARGLSGARAEGFRVAFTDFQKVNRASFESLTTLYQALAESLAGQLDLSPRLRDAWDDRRGPNANLDRYLRRQVLPEGRGHLVWALDEADRTFDQPYHSEFFGLLRAWYNERVLDPAGPSSRLTIAVTYATDVTRFITDLNQSLFNVGLRIALEDFTAGEVAELNRCHGSPLKTDTEIARFHRWLSGQPYLSQCGLHELASRPIRLEELQAEAARGGGVYRESLNGLLEVCQQAPEFAAALKHLLEGGTLTDTTTFDRLRAAGIVTGDSPSKARLRCELFAEFLRQHPI